MKAFRILYAFAIKFAIDLPVMLAGIVTFPLAYPFKYYDRTSDMWHLPRWAWIWDNDDHGIEGQGFWIRQTPEWSRFARCYVWTVFRNSSFNWSKYVLGAPKPRVAYFDGDLGIGDKKKGGGYWITTGGVLFEYYRIIPYRLAGSPRCVRIRIGWKMGGAPVGKISQFCFVFNPVMSYSGVM